MMKIALLGDIGLFGKFDIERNNDIHSYFDAFTTLTNDCDYIVGNLESPFSQEFNDFKPKSAVIGSKVENMNTLKQLGITHVNLANNHIGDFGQEGYDLTKRILTENNIDYFGIEGIQSYIHHDTNKVCLSGFCNMDTNPVYLYQIDSKHKGVNIADVDTIKNTLLQAHNKGYLNILALHTGLEHVHLPGTNDLKFCRYLSEQHPYILYGHHPHVVQGYEAINNSNLFYSLGNFCFDDVYSKASSTEPLVKMSESNKLGLVPILTIEDNTVIDIELLWTYLGDEKMLILRDDGHPIIKKVKSCFNDQSLSDISDKRQLILDSLLQKRKSRRNLRWYINRLNTRYVRLYFEAKNNRRLYNKHYSDKLKKL